MGEAAHTRRAGLPNPRGHRLEPGVLDTLAGGRTVKLTPKPAFGRGQDGETGSVLEPEGGVPLDNHWRLHLMLGSRVWAKNGESERTTKRARWFDVTQGAVDLKTYVGFHGCPLGGACTSESTLSVEPAMHGRVKSMRALQVFHRAPSETSAVCGRSRVLSESP